MSSAAENGASKVLNARREAATSYKINGWEAVEIDADETGLSELHVEALRRTECFLAQESEFETLRTRLLESSQPGWEVWGIVPLELLGAAHASLRGVTDRVQGWWLKADGSISFTLPQIP
jgi:hypothetical protein